MKFTCSQLALTKALNMTDKAVSSRTTIPILKGVLLRAEEGKLYMTSSDLDMSIETSLEVSVAEEGSLVVNAKLFGDIVRKLPNAMITAEEKDGKLNISCLGSSFSIVTFPADEFPSIGSVEKKNTFSIKKELLKEIIRRTAFAASVDDKKGILTGCLIKFGKGMIEAAALDGFRMAVAKEEAGSLDERTIVVPARILFEINRILSDTSDEEISLYADDKRIEIICSDTRIISRLLEGEFIKYEDIIPKNYKTRCIAGCADLLSGIERASLLAKEGKNNLIKMSFTEGNIEITSRSEEGNVTENIACEKEGEDLVIGFNSKYLIDSLKLVGDEEVVFEMGTAVSACLIKPVEGDAYTYLVLPVRITAG